MLFFRRSKLADAYEEKEGYLRRIEKLDQLTFADAKKEAQAIDAAAQKSFNSLVRMQSADVSKILDVHREVIAMIRLVRTAAIFHASGEIPAIADPFGDKLRFKRENGKTKIWSLGRDGTDQNGSGTWEESSPDIVLEILH
jgi:hypothetical protein